MNKSTEQYNKHLKLIQTHQNNILISDLKLKDKYTNFENSRLSESKTLLYEINSKPVNFKRYSRGRIVKVKFGVNVGSEFSGEHFAIVVSKKDTMKSSTLHVIPITSKKHVKNINIGEILYSSEEINNLKSILKTAQDDKNIKKIKTVIKYYENRKNKTSYACIDHLKTISKLSISNNINEFDYLPNLKCSNKLMKIIDESVIKEYTI